MFVESKIELKFKNEKQAKVTYDSLDVDNESFLDSDLNNDTITYYISGDSLPTVLATIDDLIACEILSEKISTGVNQQD